MSLKESSWAGGRWERRGAEQGVIQPVEIGHFISAVQTPFVPSPTPHPILFTLHPLSKGPSQINIPPIHKLGWGGRNYSSWAMAGLVFFHMTVTSVMQGETTLFGLISFLIHLGDSSTSHNFIIKEKLHLWYDVILRTRWLYFTFDSATLMS